MQIIIGDKSYSKKIIQKLSHEIYIFDMSVSLTSKDNKEMLKPTTL